MTLLLLALLAWLLLVAGLLLKWRRPLQALWQEPIFKAPVLIVESDDWGAGPPQQAEALTALTECLARHRDGHGRAPVMTLALVLSTPEPGMRACAPWRRRTLADPSLAPVMAAIRAGQARGVFALQLHGLEHFWPDALLAAAERQDEVRAWLDQPELSERLPSPLQSRWTDAAVLPSRALPATAIEPAVAAETGLFAELFGVAAEVVVPPTFVWNQTVEAAWAVAGIKVVITPGRRQTGRDAEGRPGGTDREMVNGEAGAGDILYLVRDEYFEPVYGHRPEQALMALAGKTALGRPCLLETHRWNFLSAMAADPDASLVALDQLLARALCDFPGLRFASSAELGRAIRSGDPNWIEHDRRRRFTIWLRRIAGLPRFGKAVRLTGLLPLLNLFACSDRRP